MNLFRVLVQQVDDAGAWMMRRLLIVKEGGRSKVLADYFFAIDDQSRQRAIFRGAAIRPADWKLFPKGARAILQALVRHVRDEALESDEQEALKRALNRPILAVSNQVWGPWPPYYLGLAGMLDRVLADTLVNYLSFFHRDRRLFKHKPIGLCPVCEGLFLKLKSNQRYCSGECRMRDWISAHPEYWKDNEGELARRRKRQRVRSDGRKPSKRPGKV